MKKSGIDHKDKGLNFLAGGSEMGERIRHFDWSRTPLGPIEYWPQSLKTAARIMLGSRYQMFIWWGDELINLYNDAYAPLLGQRHPSGLGQPAEPLWHEIWPVVGPQTQIVLRDNRATWNDRVRLIMERNGYPEEMFVTWSYSPVPDDDGGVGGVFCVCYEETERVLNERRLATLRQLADETTGAQSAEEACRLAVKTLGKNPWDISFALIYLLDRDGGRAQLAASIGLEPGKEIAPQSIIFMNGNYVGFWPFDRTLRGERVKITELTRRAALPGGAWIEPAHTAVALPLAKGAQERPSGFVVLGASPRLAFNDSYQGFFELVSTSIASAIAKARAFEEERKRVEALAEIDRAKTTFFSNVSHEFRTPLTLLLGPLEETLAQSGDLSAQHRERLEIAHRNSLRLLKLVNTLLDFSRIEAGRIQAVYEPTDLGAYTAELASVFRSAIEKAGLELIIDCSSLPDSVYVDRDMWEKIVLNLLSNAFKFTFEGEISVSLRQAGEMVELGVRDTGAGISPGEVPHLFERFHQVKGARGRSLEGSGIGLAMVQELVKLHGGAIRVESEVDHGATFTVAIPLGAAHLPTDRVGTARPLTSTGLRGEIYVEEVLRWLPETQNAELGMRNGAHGADTTPHLAPFEFRNSLPRVLLAEDNADMREYVWRLLSRRYEVETVTDGLEALDAARERTPDLVLTDVMMPRLDGFGLLKELRADERLKAVPVILLSARAGEEASVEGIESGADDYLIKPFSARELVARVDAHLKMARLRAEGEAALRDSEAKLAIELADSRQLQRVSSSLIEEENIDALYGQILEAASAVMRSDSASIQMLVPERNELLLLAHKGFLPESAAYWRRVRLDHASSCALAMSRSGQVIVPDVEVCDFLAGTQDLAAYRLSGIRATQSTPLISRAGRLVGMISTHWHEVHQPSERVLRIFAVLARQAADLIERRAAEEALRINENRLRGQKEAFQAAIDGAPLAESLGILTRIVTEETAGSARTGFYLANPDFTCLHPIRGAGDMPDSYTKLVDRFPIGHESLACGLASATGRPVLTRDVFEEPLWKPWVHLAEAYDFRGCWSFPIETRNRKHIGTFAMYFREAREATPHDLALAEVVTQAAAIIISRHRLEQEVADRTAELRVRVAERDALLNEVHHRVKNNLHVIGSLLEMQANRVDDPQTYSQFEDACNRVVSIAEIHEVLYKRGRFSDIGLGEYARDMAERLTAFYGLGERVKVAVHDTGITLDLDRATSFGLVLNELISNSCKHGFPNGRTGEIIIRLTQGEGRIRVEVADTGIGFVNELGTGASLGLKLVRTIVGQNLAGTVDLNSEHGARAIIEMPERAKLQ